MRGPFLLACLATAMFSPLGRAAEFPYMAYVSSDDVYIRSGPGKNYYPTAKLKRGEQVEVYRHDPGGWYAIRPPRQSFSWVSARQVDPAEKGLAVINTERAVARVGSIFSDMRDVIQVRLNRGERVELLESQPVADGKWYKIAPPAGEFRWIHREYLDRHAPPEDVVSDDRNDSAETAQDEEEESPTARRIARLGPRHSIDEQRTGRIRRRRCRRAHRVPPGVRPRPTVRRPGDGRPRLAKTPRSRSPGRWPISISTCRRWWPKRSEFGPFPTCVREPRG